MLIHDTLDMLASSAIPKGRHRYLHVDSRRAWVKAVVSLYESKAISMEPKNLKLLLHNWEQLLYQKYSSLN